MTRVSSLSLLVLLALSGMAKAETSFDLSLKTKPTYRGVLLATDNQPVVQALVEYTTETGLYAGIWASRLQTDQDGRDSEVDYFVGYQRRLTTWFAIDTTLQRYTYQGGEFGNRYDWSELQLATHLGNHLTLIVAAGDNWIGSKEHSYIAELSWRYAVNERFTVLGNVGKHFAERVIPNNFAYREAGLSTVFGGYGIQATWTDTVGIGTERFLADNTISLSVSRQIEF